MGLVYFWVTWSSILNYSKRVLKHIWADLFNILFVEDFDSRIRSQNMKTIYHKLLVYLASLCLIY